MKDITTKVIKKLASSKWGNPLAAKKVFKKKATIIEKLIGEKGLYSLLEELAINIKVYIWLIKVIRVYNLIVNL